MLLTAHFRTEEFKCHDGTPVPLESHRALLRLCLRYLEPLRSRFGPVYVASGHRPQAYNDAHGGAPLSQHVYGAHGYGVAADVMCQRGYPTDWFEFLDALGPGGLGQYLSYVHVDNRRGRARW